MRRRRAFALTDAGGAAVVLAALCAAGMVAGGQGRKSAGLAASLGNLQRMAEVTAAYGADNDDRFWTFSWKAGDRLSQYADLNDAATDLQAAANQAVDILRRRFDESVPLLVGWLPHMKTSTLVLADYLEESLPMEWAASPGDAFLLGWQADPYAVGDDWAQRRRAFWSSYVLPTAFVAPDAYPTVVQAHVHNIYMIPPDVPLGGRRIAEVAHPSRKVQLSEEASWFFGPRPAFYLHDEARVPAVMVDGSAAARTSADANAGWDSSRPGIDQDDQFWYEPSAWEVPAFDGSGSDLVFGKYRWTRQGLGGVDFDGARPE